MHRWHFDLFCVLWLGAIYCSNSFVLTDEQQGASHAVKKQRPPMNGRSGEGAFERERRVVGGKNAEFEQWPYQIALFKHSLSCGGSIVHPDWVLTAAHCVVFTNGSARNPDEVTIVAGMWDRTKSDQEEPLRQRRKVIAIIPHEDYNDTEIHNDIVLLRLNESLDMNEAAQIVCLNDRVVTETAELYATGWGVTNRSLGHMADILQFARMDFVASDVCSEHMPYITEKKICAGNMKGGVDTCQGDSGGPLVMGRTDGRYALVGITSYGYSCALPEKPGVYTNVYDYIDWILENSGGDVTLCS